MELQVREYVEPVIKVNYEDLKAELESRLDDYRGLVVTEDTLAGCKAAQKELAGLRNKIDTARKEKKKELEKPIKEFEAQCKELIALIEDTEKPIKEGIKVYDDIKRDEKRQQAQQIIDEVIAAQGLNEKYAARLDVLDKYMNLTATAKGVKEDVETRAFALKVEQDREQERIDIIQGVIDSENERINTKLSIKDFEYCMMYSNISTSEVITEIKNRAQQIYDAENAPKEPQEVVERTLTPPTEEKPQETPENAPEKQYSATYKVVGSVAELRSVSNFLREHGITYTVTEQIEL